MGRNIVRFYVEKTRIGPKQKFDEIVSKLGTTSEFYFEHEFEYYTFVVSRPNHFSMSNGTVMKIDLDDPLPSVDDYVKWIKDLVDNIV
jgi:hypothetical protein